MACAGYGVPSIDSKSFGFASRGQVVLFAGHAIRLDEIVLEDGTGAQS